MYRIVRNRNNRSEHEICLQVGEEQKYGGGVAGVINSPAQGVISVFNRNWQFLCKNPALFPVFM